MKSNFITFLFLLLIAAPSCLGAAVTDSMLTVVIPSAAVVNTIPSAMNNSSINPQTGIHTGLGAVFNVKTNGDDNTYDFVLSSSINTDAGEQNGYFLKNGEMYLILANKEHLPDQASTGFITVPYAVHFQVKESKISMLYKILVTHRYRGRIHWKMTVQAYMRQ